MTNPLLSEFDTPYELPPFDQIDISHYVESIEVALDEAKSEIDLIKNNESAPDFENAIEALEKSGRKLARNSSILFNLNSAETTDEIQQITQEISPKLSAFSSDIKQDETLFNKVKAVYGNRESLNLSSEQHKLLHETYFDFVRRGVELEGEAKSRFKEISVELSKLSLKFSENVLAETNDYELVITDANELKGLPEDLKARAKELANKKSKPDAWLFTLQAPSYIPFMEYADNRSLREKLYKAYMSKCLKKDERDNQEIILRTIKLKAELASLLGYSSFAHYILEQRMAESPDKVSSFLNDLLHKSLPKAKEEVAEIKEFIRVRGENIELQRWDWAYYSEKLRKEKYALDDEIVKPYFKLENVIKGVFATA
ncbi:MAG: M3 family metallopeptidase, partial [Bacteroidota bacterium]